ncbi:TPA: helix-turn-helix domain-containing protein [Salmonella enterica]
MAEFALFVTGGVIVMLISIGKKIRELRESEGLTRTQFFELTGILETVQKSYETGKRENIGIETVMKITNHPRFKKYTLWLMTGDLAASTVQIAPRFLSGEKDDDQ